ncbi:MAG: hypothetical protein ACFE0Q_12840 [Anaerolineae bacterium]
MIRRLSGIILLSTILWLLPAQAQDALNLPSELYVLSSEGTVQRFGLGSEGLSTVTPEGEFVLDFRVAPDANWLAYRTLEGVFLRHIFDEAREVRQIEDDRASVPIQRGQGETMAWSPDSSALAYTTEYGGRVHFFADGRFVDVTTPDLIHLSWSPDGRFLAGEASGDVWWIFQRNGSTIELRAAIPGASGADWLSPTQLLHAPLEGGLTVLDLSQGNQQVEILSATEGYHLPGVSRDGQIVAFAGERDNATLTQIELDDNLVGTATPIGSDALDLGGARWAPGGFLLTAFEAGVIALINPITANGFTLPVTGASTYSWGPAYPPLTINQTLPESAYFIANDENGVRQVWELPADGTRAGAITPAPLNVTEYAISPNRQRIAYVSNSVLWLYSIGSEDVPQEWVMLGINEQIAPAWGADNQMLYYRDDQSGEAGIWRVSTEDSEPVLFLSDDENGIYTQPQPALGAGAMLVHYGDALQIADTGSGEVTAIGLNGTGRWLDGTQFMVVGDAPGRDNGIYQGDANAIEAGVSLVLPLLGSFELFDYRVLNGENLRLLVKNQVPGDVRILDIPVNGGQAQLIGSAGNMVNPRLSADGALVIGQRSSEGVLLLYDLANDSTRQIDIAPPITHFRWR